MDHQFNELKNYTEGELHQRNQSLAKEEKQVMAKLVAHLAETYRRRLHLKRSYPSLYQYALKFLNLSQAMAWRYSAAAKLTLKHGDTFYSLRDGKISLCTAAQTYQTFKETREKAKAKIKQKHKEQANQPRRQQQREEQQQQQPKQYGAEGSASKQGEDSDQDLFSERVPEKSDEKELIDRITGRSQREAKRELKEFSFQFAEDEPNVKKPRAQKTPYNREYTELRIYLDREELAKLEQLMDLLSHQFPEGDLNEIIPYLRQLAAERFDPAQKKKQTQKRKARKQKGTEPASSVSGASSEKANFHSESQERPQKQSKGGGEAKNRPSVPEAIKQAVWLRDQGQCQWQDPVTGEKCCSTRFLEYDHIRPICQGGESTLQNTRLICRQHNLHRMWLEGYVSQEKMAKFLN